MFLIRMTVLSCDSTENVIPANTMEASMKLHDERSLFGGGDEYVVNTQYLTDSELLDAVKHHDFVRFMSRIEELALANPEAGSIRDTDAVTVLFMRYKLLQR